MVGIGRCSIFVAMEKYRYMLGRVFPEHSVGKVFMFPHLSLVKKPLEWTDSPEREP